MGKKTNRECGWADAIAEQVLFMPYKPRESSQPSIDLYPIHIITMTKVTILHSRKE